MDFVIERGMYKSLHYIKNYMSESKNLKIRILTLLFLDLKKAYDSVPIYNVLMKIHHIGIRGKCYNSIENLYTYLPRLM
jgi:cytochrome c oxidase assembly protein Cox11